MKLRYTTMCFFLFFAAQGLLAQHTVSLFQPLSSRGNSHSMLSEHIRQFALLQPDSAIWATLMAERPQSLTLTLPFEDELILELEKTNPLAHDFILTASNSSGGTDTLDYDPGLHYSGKIAGEAHSLVAISIFADQIMGVISDASSNINLGRLNTDAARAADIYVMFRDVDLVNPPKMECGTPDSLAMEIPVDYAKLGDLAKNNLPVNACPVRIFIDCDQKLFFNQNSNTVQTTNFVTANFNIAKTIFNNENVAIELSEIHIWTTPDPFSNADGEAAIWSFKNYYTPIGFNGRLAHLVSGDNHRGYGWIDKLCSTQFNFGYTNMPDPLIGYPNYSWQAATLTHELGHNFGSAHTHFCGWPGGAIDNCEAPEGNCPWGPPPVNGGTIMSYCGQNYFPLSNGFGPMPGWVIRDRAMNAGCIQALNDYWNQPTVCGCTPDPGDVQELINLFNATGGVNWANNTNWLNYNNYNWHGVRWVKVGNKCRVRYIDLHENGLAGQIPNLNLPELQRLILDKNELSGQIPNFNFPKLFALQLDSNQLSGSIPVFNFPELWYLDLTENKLTGSIPTSNYPKLEYLWLAANQLSGTIPNFNYPKLKSLWLRSNQLTGSIPNFNSPDLEYLNLADNLLSGSIPSFNFPKLTSLNLWRNQLSGNIPIFNFPNLVFLDLSRNQLTGSIPNFNFPMIRYFYIGVNRLTDSIPNFNFPELRGFWLASNQLSGTIPNFNFPEVTYFGLHYNQLSGTIPNFNFPLLDTFRIQVNNLTFNGFYQFFSNNFSEFTYQLQNRIPVHTTPNCNTLYVKAGGVIAHNTYKWYKIGTGLVATIVGDSLYTPTLAGQYYCEVTNSVVTGLTLTSEIVQKGSAFVAISGTTDICTGSSTVLNAGSGYSTYQWSNGATTQQITATASGTYTVTVSVAPGCTGTAQAVVTTTAYPQPNIQSSTPAICNGNTTATLNAGSGYGAYLWSNGKTTQTIDVTQAGTYTVTVTNAPGCSGTATYTLNALAAANPVVSGIAPICPGQNLTLSVGSFAAYTWSSGGTTSSVSVDQPGTYSVTVTNAAGCTGIANAVVPNNPLSVSILGDQQICTGGFTVLDAGNGFTSYTWSNGTTTRTNEVATSGYFTVTVTNAQGCTGTATLEVVEAPSPAPFPNIQGLTIVCGGSSTTLNAGNGYASYLWSTGSTAQSINVNQSGTYTVTVTDASGCKGKGDATVTFGTTPVPQISGVTSPCVGQSNGSATVTANGGVPPYTYLWSNGQTGETANNLDTGNYFVTVTGNDGCSSTVNITINSAASPIISITNAISSCVGQSNGFATVTASGGAPPYTYIWSNGQTGATAIYLDAGNYLVTVTGNNGCSSTANIYINSEASPIAGITNTVSPCVGQSTGSATVTASGGIPPYAYMWNNGQIGETANNLTAGNYFVTVTGNNGCSSTTTVNISSEATPTASISSTVSPCVGQSNGSATIVASGGIPPYAYMWNNGQIGATANNLTAGNYFVTVTGYNGCSSTTTVNISSAASPTASISSTVFPCVGQSNGSATIVASGGIPPYTYTWSNGQSGATGINLAAGTYFIAVEDNNGCSSVVTATLTNVPVFNIELLTNPEPNGQSCQSSAAPQSGTPPYSYLWSNGQTTQTASDLPIGQFSVSVTDASGCASIQTGSCIPVSTNEISDIEFFSIKPNPANSYLSIQIRLKQAEDLQMRFFNSIGQQLYGNTFNSQVIDEVIDLSDFPSGCYFLQFTTPNGSKSEIITIAR